MPVVSGVYTPPHVFDKEYQLGQKIIRADYVDENFADLGNALATLGSSGGGTKISTNQGNLITNNEGIYLSIGTMSGYFLAKPTSGSIVYLANSSGVVGQGKIVLPGGGTWAWYYWAINFNNIGVGGGAGAGVSAGGTTVYSGTVDTCSGWAWRIS